MKTKIFLMITALVLLTLTSCKKDMSLLEQSSIDLAADDAFLILDNLPCPHINFRKPDIGLRL